VSSANNAGYFKEEISGVQLKNRKGVEESFEVDEHPKETTIEILAKLKPVFKKDGLVIYKLIVEYLRNSKANFLTFKFEYKLISVLINIHNI